MKRISLIFLLMISLILVGCTKANIEVFRFVNHEVSVQIGQEVTLDLIYGEYSETDKVTYTLSEEGVISLNGNVATGLAIGEVTVTATIDGIKTAKLIVRVENEFISSMKINSTKNNLYVGEYLNLTVTVFPNHLSNDVVWSIENSNLSKFSAASISQTGVLTGLKGAESTNELSAGGAKIIVVATSTVDPTMSVKKEFYIKYYSTEQIQVTAEKTSINIGETVQLNSTITPNNSCPVVTYKSSDETLLIVNSTGLVTTPANSEKIGTATITVTTLDNISTTIDITVNESQGS